MDFSFLGINPIFHRFHSRFCSASVRLLQSHFICAHAEFLTFSPPPVLVRYVRADGKIHTVNLQNAAVADNRPHSVILRLGGLQRDHMNVELYVDCRLADSSQGLPSLVPLPREAEMVEIRNGQKAYARLQVGASG